MQIPVLLFKSMWNECKWHLMSWTEGKTGWKEFLVILLLLLPLDKNVLSIWEVRAPEVPLPWVHISSCNRRWISSLLWLFSWLSSLSWHHAVYSKSKNIGIKFWFKICCNWSLRGGKQWFSSSSFVSQSKY